VGDVCFVEDVPPGIYMSDLILRLRPDPTQIAAGYLANALLTTDARRQISESARGTSGSMRKISRELIRTYTIPCPDLSIQESVLKSLESAAKVQAACAALSRTLLGVRKVVAAELLTGAHRIPETYDESLGEAV
jgi:type I restriction enzyme S subunit